MFAWKVKSPISVHPDRDMSIAPSRTRQARFVRCCSARVRSACALRLQEGMQVIVRGRLTVYEPRGEYQIVLEMVEPKGIGALQLAFEQLKERLAAEGLFDPARKKALPAIPENSGNCHFSEWSSHRDILAVLRRRWPTLHVLIAPVLVQGERAGHQIAAALGSLNEQGLCRCHYCRPRRRIVRRSLEL